MERIKAHLRELQSALGDRLPPAVHAARLREARAHLLASTEEVGEAEAVRRYGRARTIANEFVREHRGYGARSSWRLASALTVAFMVSLVLFTTYPWIGAPSGMASLAVFIALGRAVHVLVALTFAARVVQTRRWLALPMAATYASGVAFLMVVNHRWLAPRPWMPIDLALLGFYFAASVAVWSVVNVAALGVGHLLDRRGAGDVRRAR